MAGMLTTAGNDDATRREARGAAAQRACARVASKHAAADGRAGVPGRAAGCSLSAAAGGSGGGAGLAAAAAPPPGVQELADGLNEKLAAEGFRPPTLAAGGGGGAAAGASCMGASPPSSQLSAAPLMAATANDGEASLMD